VLHELRTAAPREQVVEKSSLQRIATQRWTHAAFVIDFVVIFLEEPSLRNGFTAYSALSPGCRAC
jgi:hypothetical protein